MKNFLKVALTAASLLGMFAGSAQAAPAPKVRIALIV